MNKGDAESTFEPLSVTDTTSTKSLTVAFNSEFYIKNALFQLVFLHNEKGTSLAAQWINRDFSFEMNDVAAYFGIEFPDWLNFELFIETVRLKYSTINSQLNFQASIRNFGKFILDSSIEPKKDSRNYTLTMNFDRKLELTQLPIIGQFCDPGDGFHFKSIGLKYTPSVELVFSFISQLIIKQYPLDVNVDYVQSLKPKPPRNMQLLQENEAQAGGNKIYWLEINKGLSVLYFSKIGVSLQESRLTFYLDASFTIAILRLDFYELYVSTSLKKLSDIHFGLSGLMASLHTPAFSLTGGLYKAPDSVLYNGVLGLKISQYGFQAIGSYGEMPGSGEKTFFAYLMLGVPLGGPPQFFVNGLALGFGVNRTLMLPGLEGVRKFPLVAAAAGDDSELKPNTPPSQALSALSEAIKPESGQYFLSAGIRFLTYGVLEVFALLNIELGKRLVISLLGVANASIPPKVDGVSPIVRAELAVKMSFDPSQGEIFLGAQLTDRSYLFHPSCKLTGGFAIAFWFAGEYAGDFIVTLGGCHHPEFHNIHYPTVAPLGVSWVINDNISVKGEAYFALTPSCMMAGASLNLLFELGNLKAWFSAAADFILKWKPFFYQARVHVSVGASYRISIFGIGKTFKIELGAGLTIWGPEFSGKVHIDWYIISFTIGFGANSPNEPGPIDWDDFAGSFIPEASKKSAANNSLRAASDETQLSSVSISDGLLAQYATHDGKTAYVVDGYRASFIIEQKMPSSDLLFNETSLLDKEANFDIVPMNLTNVSLKQKVTFEHATDKQAVTKLNATPILRNAPTALWGKVKDKPNEVVRPNMPMGMTITADKQFSVVNRLPAQGGYKEEILNERESITRRYTYQPPIFPEKKEYPTEPEARLSLIQETIGANVKRNALLQETASAFGTLDAVTLGSIAVDPQAVLFAVPQLRTTGCAV